MAKYDLEASDLGGCRRGCECLRSPLLR